jgi:hypothetical protein
MQNFWQRRKVAVRTLSMTLATLEKVFRALNDANVRYLVVGGLAVNAHGYVRATRGLDLVIGLAPENILNGLGVLEAVGYRPRVPVTPEQFADPALREQWRNEKQMIVLQLWSDAFERTPVDVFVYELFDFDAEWAAAIRQPLVPGVDVPFVRLEVLFAMKTEAGRSQDLVDIEKLRRINL